MRKWVLPGLSEPLLIVRDPIAIWLMVKAMQGNLWKPNSYVILMWGVSVLAFILTLFVGHGNLIVALYGLRITAVYFPLVFIIGAIFEKQDVMNLGRILLWINIGMTLLVAVQFFSPQSAWVNRGIGGDMEGSGFGATVDFFRVPGTFSFTNGLALFYGFTAAFVFYFWFENKYQQVSMGLLWASTIALLAAVPLSISRTVFFEIAITFVFMLFIVGKNPKFLSRIFGFVILLVGFLLVLNNFSFFQTATATFSDRFSSANQSEGGIEGVFLDRFLGGMYGAIVNEEISFWGLGLGMGSNVGAKLIAGRLGFLISEGEWGRLIGEMGFILGIIVILIRATLVVQLLGKAWNLIQTGNILPWFLMSFGTLILFQGQWAQPTSLGFFALIGGLIVASMKEDSQGQEGSEEVEVENVEIQDQELELQEELGK